MNIAHPAPQPTREQRGIALAQEHFEQIVASYRHSTYCVPSCVGEHTYSVRYGRHVEESCTFPDWQWSGKVCKHAYAVAIVHARTANCSGCGSRVRRRDLLEVQESLTFHTGDLTCSSCWHGSDAIVL